MRSCKLDVGAGRGVVELDDQGRVISANEYAESAIEKWAEVIGFERVIDPPPEEAAPRRKSRSPRRRTATN